MAITTKWEQQEWVRMKSRIQDMERRREALMERIFELSRRCEVLAEAGGWDDDQVAEILRKAE